MTNDKPRRNRFRITGRIHVNEPLPEPQPPGGPRVRQPAHVAAALKAHDERLEKQGREFNPGAFGDDE